MKKHYDIIVIGGGISGLGVALEARRRGLDVLVLEKDRCLGATSSNSLRIIHGGLRYLQGLNLGRVVQSLRDQAALLKWAPDHIRPLPCVMPLKSRGMKSRLPVSGAIKFYSLLRRIAAGEGDGSRLLSSAFVEKEIALLHGLAPHGALMWNDALIIDPGRFHDFVRDQMRAAGAEVNEGMCVLSCRRAQNPEGVRVVCAQGAEYMCKVAVNAAGPWLSNIESEFAETRPQISWCKAFNIVLTRRLEKEYAVGVSTEEGRLIFVVPRGEVSAIGTCYVPIQGKPALQPGVSPAELESFIAEINRALPSARIGASDVSRLDIGLLPCRESAGREPLLYGAERIRRYGRYIEIISTKYTTFLSQARTVVNLAQRYCIDMR